MTDPKKILHRITDIYNQLSDRPINEVQMIKIMYLLDRAYFKENEYQLSNFTYVKYNLGPYSGELSNLIEEAQEDHMFHETKMEEDQHTYYRVCNCPQHTVDVDISDEIDSLIRSIVSDYYDSTTKSLVQDVRSREEVENVEKYGLISYSDISA